MIAGIIQNVIIAVSTVKRDDRISDKRDGKLSAVWIKIEC